MKWIKCIDRFPENEQECLVVCRHFSSSGKYLGQVYKLAIFMREDFEFFAWDLGKTLNWVTHWMPLPDCPNE